MGGSSHYCDCYCLFSCKEHLPVTGSLVREETPSTVVDDMTYPDQFRNCFNAGNRPENGEVYGRMNPAIFPMGINVKAYNQDGALETEITPCLHGIKRPGRTKSGKPTAML